MQPSEIRETFRGATLVELLLEPATSVLDMAMKANCFANESKVITTFVPKKNVITKFDLTKDDARRIILAGGLHINQAKCTDYTQILSLGRHILSNGISLIRVGELKRGKQEMSWTRSSQIVFPFPYYDREEALLHCQVDDVRTKKDAGRIFSRMNNKRKLNEKVDATS